MFLAGLRGIPAESYRAGRSGFPDYVKLIYYILIYFNQSVYFVVF